MIFIILLMKALYRFRCSGPPELVEILEMALESQWLHGYPRSAPHCETLTVTFSKTIWLTISYNFNGSFDWVLAFKKT